MSAPLELAFKRVQVVKQTGDQKVDTLVLVHGMTSAGATFWAGNNLMEKFSERLNVIAVDLRGHGQSPESDTDDYSLPPMAEDLKAFADKHGLKGSTHWLGHSWGSRVVLTFAELYPEYCKSVIVEDEYIDADPVPKQTWDEAQKDAASHKAKWRPHFPSYDECFAFLEGCLGKDRVDYSRKIMKTKAPGSSEDSPDVFAPMFKPHVAHIWDFHCCASDRNVVWKNTDKYPFKVHIQKAGGESSDIKAEMWEKLTQETKEMNDPTKRSLSVIPEAGHPIHRTHLVEFITDILDHLENSPGATLAPK